MIFLTKIDQFLNSITMYRLLLYGLLVLVFISFCLSILGLLPYSFIQFFGLFLVIITVCTITHFILLKLYRAVTNTESYLITSIILYFIIAPITSVEDVFVTIGISVMAIGSRYFIAVKKRHIFNPAAIGVFLIGLLGYGNGIWWVGSSVLLPFVFILGLLIVRKVRRFKMVLTFLVVSAFTIIFFNVRNGLTPLESLSQIFTSWPIIFFATIMLTEPFTMPGRKRFTLYYGALVGVFFGSQLHIGPVYSSPEFALLVGNIFSYFVSSPEKLFLTFHSKTQIGKNIYELEFTKPAGLNFLPGQYLEWTIPPGKSDSRGNRRYFTIASSPRELRLKLGIKTQSESSSWYKNQLLDLKKGDVIVADQLSGDFVLEKGNDQKVVFIAGGIGITPFRSIIQDMIDTKTNRNITLFYACSDVDEFVYQDVFNSALKYGLTVNYIITKKDKVPKGWKGEVGYLDSNMITKHVGNVESTRFYLSGPDTMVRSYKKLLLEMGAKYSQITTDYFPGF